jgi:hypothetical protein
MMALALTGSACGSGASPTAAIAPPTTMPRPAASPGPSGPPIAVLAVAEFGPGRVTDVRLVLIETSGRSGATFDPPIIVKRNGDREIGCGGGRIAANGRWELDSSDYCAPLGDGSSEGMGVLVHFQDDGGRRGTMASTMAAADDADPRPRPPMTMIAHLAATVAPGVSNSSHLYYGFDLVLSETSGTSGVTVESLELSAEGGETLSDCGAPGLSAIRIPAHGTWSLSSLGYCAPYAVGAHRASTVRVSLVYRDDRGRRGVLEATGQVVAR